MLDNIATLAPNTMNMFTNTLMFSYGITLKEFSDKSPYHQYSFIKGYFGYSMTLPGHLDNERMVREISELFTGYELLILNKIPNFWLQLKEMSNQEKELYMDQTWIKQINTSLCHSIVKCGKIFRESLKDSLVELPEHKRYINRAPIIRKKCLEIVPDTFWEDVKRNPVLEEVPF